MIDEIKKLRELTETITKSGYLRSRTEEWEFVLDSLPDSIYITDNDYEIKFINRQLKRKLGLKNKREVYDKICYEVIKGVPDLSQAPPDPTKPTVSLEIYVDALEGWYVINRSPIITDTNKLIGFIVILKDVTEKREAEFSSQARQHMLETIYKASPIGIGVVEKDTRIIKFVNHAVCDMLCFTEEQLIAKNARVLYATEQEYERVGIEKHGKVEHQRVVSLETQWRRSDGTVLDIFLSSSKIPNGNDIVFTAMDITEVKRNERYLKRNEERLEALLELSKLSYLDDDAITQYALEEAVRLTDSKIGYLHFVDNCDIDSTECEVNLNLFTWSEEVKKNCTAEKVRHYPLESAGIWADCIRQRKPVIHNDYKNVLNKKGLPEGHVPLDKHLSVPIFDEKRIVAVAGVGNKELDYDQTDVYQLSVFMNSMWGILSRKRAERDAEENKRSLERLITSTPMGVLVYSLIDHNLVLTHFNKAAERILNMTSESIVGKKLQEVFPKLGDTKIVDNYKKIALDGGLFKVPAFYYEDEELNIKGTFSVFAFQSRVGEIAVFFADVTEQVEAQAALQKSEERFKAAFMTIPDPAIMLEAGSGRVVAINPAACRISEFTEDELVGSNITDLSVWLNIDDRESFYEILYEYGEVENFPITVKTKSGRVKEGIFSSRLFDLNGVPHVISIIKDISALVELRKNICDTELLYKSIIDKILEGVFLIQNEKFILINKPLCNILGYEERELEGQNFTKIVTPEKREEVLRNHRARLRGDPSPDSYYTVLLSKTGEKIEVKVDANVVNYNGDLGSMGVITKVM